MPYIFTLQVYKYVVIFKQDNLLMRYPVTTKSLEAISQKI